VGRGRYLYQAPKSGIRDGKLTWIIHLKWNAAEEYALGEAKVRWNCDMRVRWVRLLENLLDFLLAG
jgi:hypothetical protein